MIAKICIKREIFKGEVSKSDGVVTEIVVNALKAINNLRIYSHDKDLFGFLQGESEDRNGGFGNLIFID